MRSPLGDFVVVREQKLLCDSIAVTFSEIENIESLKELLRVKGVFYVIVIHK